MNVKETQLKGCFVVEPVLFEDSRGLFFESFNKRVFFDKTGVAVDFVQNNISVSKKGVIRGLHMQKGDYAQAKLVQVIKGKALDVVVDVRKGSDTFGHWFSCILSEENKKQLFIPRGFLHGFSALADDTILSYKCDNYYHKDAETGVRFDDEFLNIDWGIPADEIVISEKDKGLLNFNNVSVFE